MKKCHQYLKICNFFRINNRRAVRSLPQLMIQAPPGPDPVAGARGCLVCMFAVRAAGGVEGASDVPVSDANGTPGFRVVAVLRRVGLWVK